MPVAARVVFSLSAATPLLPAGQQGPPAPRSPRGLRRTEKPRHSLVLGTQTRGVSASPASFTCVFLLSECVELAAPAAGQVCLDHLRCSPPLFVSRICSLWCSGGKQACMHVPGLAAFLQLVPLMWQRIASLHTCIGNDVGAAWLRVRSQHTRLLGCACH